jgi:hypothetical protein
MCSFNQKLHRFSIRLDSSGLENVLYGHIPHSCIHMVVKEMQRAIFDMRSMRELDICVQCPPDRARQTGMSVIKRDAGDDNVTRAYEYACRSCFRIVLHINKIIQTYMRVLTDIVTLGITNRAHMFHMHIPRPFLQFLLCPRPTLMNSFYYSKDTTLMPMSKRTYCFHERGFGDNHSGIIVMSSLEELTLPAFRLG